MARWALWLALVLVACGGEDGSSDAPRPKKPRTCLPPDGTSGFPRSVEETVALINAFPKPVSIPCVLESLDRPLALSATWNNVSAQPAYGANNPRIFIFRDDLFLSVVTKGDGRPLLEMGVRRSASSSLKAELHFPIEEHVEPAAPYERIRHESGTVCGFCHLDEVVDDAIEFAEAFRSQLIPPANNKLVELDYLTWAFETCDPALDPDRCAMFDSIFAHGEVYEASF